MPTALVTGLEGFTGRYLHRELKASGVYDVFGTSHCQEPSDKNIFCVDICDRAAVRALVSRVRPDVVVHLAAVPFVSHPDVTEIYQANVVGTRNLLEALADVDKRASSILLVSSANVYGNLADQYIVETGTVKPANDYAVSKYAMELMANLWMDKLPIVIVRPFNYTGVGQSEKFLLPKIISHFRRGRKSIELGNINVSRDYSDVRDVVSYYVKLLSHAATGDVYNICFGEAYSLDQILGYIENIAGYKMEVIVNPDYIRENEIKILRGSDKKLVDAVGGIKRRPLTETLRWMFEAEK